MNEKTGTIFTPKVMNIELTTKCPLHCPQCYCSLTGGKNIDPDVAVYWLQEAGKHGVKYVMLSGGETLCYPYLFDIIKAAKIHCGYPNVALSGVGFTQNVLDRMIEAGVHEICISLNGSKRQINELTRDGYDFAIQALELLERNGFNRTTINWVMHSNNSDDFENILDIAERYKVSSIDVIGLKPDANNQMITIPSNKQIHHMREIIRKYNGGVKISIETCYSPMLAYACDTALFGNLNNGPGIGCMAGRNAFSVNVDGKLSPCRHLEFFEDCKTLEEYWCGSEVLKAIRKMEDNKKEPCSTCYLSEHCRPCLAISLAATNEFCIGNKYCSLWNKEKL